MAPGRACSLPSLGMAFSCPTITRQRRALWRGKLTASIPGAATILYFLIIIFSIIYIFKIQTFNLKFLKK